MLAFTFHSLAHRSDNVREIPILTDYRLLTESVLKRSGRPTETNMSLTISTADPLKIKKYI